MKVSVFDTYVQKKDGGLMHFDVIVPQEIKLEQAIEFGKQYLKSAGQEGQPLTSRECRFCHVENASPEVQEAIQEKGYYILEMEGCR